MKQIIESGMNTAVFANNAMIDRSAIDANPSLYEEVVTVEVQIPSKGKAVTIMETLRLNSHL